jgi:hypothetical protein
LYSDRQVADARTDVCAAVGLSRSEVAENTHRPDYSGDEVGSLASFAMKRLAVFAAGDYLLERLREQPATPSDLTDAVRALADSYEAFAMHALNSEPEPSLDPFRHAVDRDLAQIDPLCK